MGIQRKHVLLRRHLLRPRPALLKVPPRRHQVRVAPLPSPRLLRIDPRQLPQHRALPLPAPARWRTRLRVVYRPPSRPEPLC